MLLNWAIPFLVLLPRRCKQSQRILSAVASVVLLGRFVDLYQMVYPPIVGGSPGIGGWGLRGSTATWKVISTSVPLSIPKGRGTTGKGYDGWAGGGDGTGFEHERQVIIDAILNQRIRNVVFLAGDVHYVQANAYDLNGDGVPDFHEFIAGSLSAVFGRMTLPSSTLKPTNLIHEGGYLNFGMIRATPSSFDVTVVDDAGKVRFSHRLSAK